MPGLDINTTTIKLYKTNSGALFIQANDDQIWNLGDMDFANLPDQFTTDASSWVDGDWEPSWANGQQPASPDGLTLVASWNAIDDEVKLHVDADQMGATARMYALGR